MKNKEKYIKPMLLFIGISMMAYGINIGEPEIVFKKAVVICLECIGVG